MVPHLCKWACSKVRCQAYRQLSRTRAVQTAEQSISDGSSIQVALSSVTESKTAYFAPNPQVAQVMKKLTLSLEDVSKVFPFALDPAQTAAISVVLEGHSVVVAAPTGSGKTAIAEAATIAALARGQRVVYTTPLKALSNQKLYEFRKLFGTNRVGLQTGDASLNAEGDVVVMTTEVMRNIMYRGAHDAATGRSGQSERLGTVGLLVLDEVHYLGDPSRGSVWEEVIINCPPHIQILGMSATIANSDDLGAWINKVHGSCKTLVSMDRPVPLAWNYCHADNGKAHIKPLLDARSQKINPDLVEGEYDNAWMGQPGSVTSARKRLQELLEQQTHLPDIRLAVPDKDDVIRKLGQAGMLPAIWFIFSRVQCDAAARQTYQAGVRLTKPNERAAIQREVILLRQEQSEAVRDALVPALLVGIASHHAGCLPGWKSLVERLFQRGLLKVVFATETLAAGINMPARSTVLSSVSRRRDNGHSLLTHNELMQMAGRAGRRGYDTEGFCVIVHNQREEPQSSVGLLLHGPEPLQSQFESGYGMALNLLFSRTLEQARDFIERSFSSYLSNEGLARRRATIQGWEDQAQLMLQAAERAEIAAGGAEAAFKRYTSLRASIRERRKALKGVLSQALTLRSQAAETALASKGNAQVVGLELEPLAAAGGSSTNLAPLTALVVGELTPPEGVVGRQSFLSQIWYLCISADNRLLKVRSEHVANVSAGKFKDAGKAANIVIDASAKAPTWAALSGGAYFTSGTLKTASLAAGLGAVAPETALQMDTGFTDSMDDIEAEIATMRNALAVEKQAAGKQRSSREDLDLRAKATKLQKRARIARKELEGSLTGNWRAFEDVVAVLVAAGALEPSSLRPTALGLVARDIQGRNQLWLAIVLTHNAVQTLSGPQLSGLVGGMVAADAVARPMITAAYPPSETVVEAVEAMEPDRSRLFDLQVEGNVPFPLEVDLRLAGIVEAWAAGSTWAQIMDDCNLDDGDIARLLSRTVDLLRQASHCTALLPQLRRTAREAAAVMTRSPISELVA